MTLCTAWTEPWKLKFIMKVLQIIKPWQKFDFPMTPRYQYSHSSRQSCSYNPCFYPKCKLRNELKETVKWNINRESMDDKHRALLDLMPSLQADIKRQVRVCCLTSLLELYYLVTHG